MEAKITYFDKKGKQNTEETLRLARSRAEELGVKHVVVASIHGYTALKAAEIFQGSGIEVIAVSISTAFAEEGWTMSPKERHTWQWVTAHNILLPELHTLANTAKWLYESGFFIGIKSSIGNEPIRYAYQSVRNLASSVPADFSVLLQPLSSSLSVQADN